MIESNERAYQTYKAAYGIEPEYMVSIPGRVNIIGEHIDYNDEFVLPCAIDRDAVVAIEASSDNKIHSISCDFDALDNFSISDDIIPSDQSWIN